MGKIKDINLLKKLFYHDVERGSLDIYLNKFNQLNDFRYINSIWKIEEYRALKSFFIDNNLEQTKQHFYLCGKLDEFLIKNNNTILLPHRIIYALLSDNANLINSYAEIEYIGREVNINFIAIQNILKDDMEALKNNIKTIEKLILKKRNWEVKFYELCKLFYQGIINNEKEYIKNAITSLVESKFQKKRVLSYTINLLDSFGTGFSKLAWRRGIEIEVESSLVPKELLPIKPNKKYLTPYNFLNNPLI